MSDIVSSFVAAVLHAKGVAVTVPYLVNLVGCDIGFVSDNF